MRSIVALGARSARRALVRGGWLALASALAACEVTGGPPATQTPAEQFCGTLGEYVSACAPTACDHALVADCSALTGLVSGPFLTAAAACVREGRPPGECAREATAALQPTDTHRRFAATFCRECAFGVGGCEALIAGAEGEGDERLRAVRHLVAALGEPVVAALEDECVSGLTCAATFPSCAQRVLVTQGLPTETVRCLVDQLLGRGEAPPPSDVECRLPTRPGTDGAPRVDGAVPRADGGALSPDAGGGRPWCPVNEPWSRDIDVSGLSDVCSPRFVACWDSCRGDECGACFDLDPPCYDCVYQHLLAGSLDRGCRDSWEAYACCVNTRCPCVSTGLCEEGDGLACIDRQCRSLEDRFATCLNEVPNSVYFDAYAACIPGR